MKIMNAKEMERWLRKKGAVPVSKEIKKKPWYKEVRKLPSCLKAPGGSIIFFTFSMLLC